MFSLEQFLDSIETGSGFWNPLVWILVIIIAYILVYVIRSFGAKGYKKDTEQVKSFLSGNPEYPKDKMHVKSSNLYWGFTTAMGWPFTIFRRMHTGNASDYVLWFIIVLAIFLIIGVI